MQYVITNGSHGRALAKLDDNGEPQGSIRICTQAQIQNMSAGSRRLYRKKILSWNEAVHQHGTPEAIRTIDYLRNATSPVRETPVC